MHDACACREDLERLRERVVEALNRVERYLSVVELDIKLHALLHTVDHILDHGKLRPSLCRSMA